VEHHGEPLTRLEAVQALDELGVDYQAGGSGADGLGRGRLPPLVLDVTDGLADHGWALHRLRYPELERAAAPWASGPGLSRPRAGTIRRGNPRLGRRQPAPP